MVWSLALLCPDDTKQDSVVYGAEFGVVLLLAKGPGTASIQEGLDCLRLNHSGREGERVKWAKNVQYIPWLQCFSSNLGIHTLANCNNPAVFEGWPGNFLHIFCKP